MRHQEQRARVVVDAVAVAVARDVERRVLQHARVVRHEADVREIDLRQLRPTLRERPCGETRAAARRIGDACLLEGLDIAARHDRPAHGLAERGRALLEPDALHRVVEETDDLATDRLGVAPRNEDASTLVEELACVAIGRGDDRLPASDRVGERARRALLLLEVRGHVEVGGAEELDELLVADEAIVEDDVGVDAEALRARLKHVSVGLAVLLLDVRMRRAEHDVDGVRMLREDRGHRVDHVLDALVGREEAEGEDDRAALDAELVLATAIGRDGNAVRDDVDLRRVHAVHGVEERRAVAAHDDEAVGEADERVHHGALHGIGLREDRVERRDDRHAEIAQELEHVAAGLRSEDAVLVLDGDDVDGADVEEVSGAPVRGDVALGDLEAYARRVRMPAPTSFIASTKQSSSGISRSMASLRSVVNVAMPHCLGR